MSEDRGTAPTAGSGGGLKDTSRERFTPGLIGFYLSCTVFGIAAAVAAVAFIAVPRLLPQSGNTGFVVGWIAGVVCLVSGATTWHYLRINRRESGA